MLFWSAALYRSWISLPCRDTSGLPSARSITTRRIYHFIVDVPTSGWQFYRLHGKDVNRQSSSCRVSSTTKMTWERRWHKAANLFVAYVFAPCHESKRSGLQELGLIKVRVFFLRYKNRIKNIRDRNKRWLLLHVNCPSVDVI